jgi:hypothetical protein
MELSSLVIHGTSRIMKESQVFFSPTWKRKLEELKIPNLKKSHLNRIATAHQK